MIKILTYDLWPVIKSHSKKSRRTRVAIAYFGTGASKYLSLKKGDTLLVAMSMGNVRIGQVNPFELEKLFQRGVCIFNLPNLHSKIYSFDKSVIIGSANASINSAENLIETAIITDEKKVINQANKFIEELCIEKVEQDYIEVCKKIYNPPKYFSNLKKKPNSSKFKGQLSRLWFISTKPIDFNEEDIKYLEKGNEKFEKKISNRKVFELTEIRYPSSSSFIHKVREGDIIIEVVNHKVKSKAIQPKRALGVSWNKKKTYGFLRVEERKKLRTKSWTTLKKILQRNGVKGITKNSTMEVTKDAEKKVLLEYFS